MLGYFGYGVTAQPEYPAFENPWGDERCDEVPFGPNIDIAGQRKQRFVIYKKRKRLGAGAFAITYLGKDLKNESQVAIKV